jgi:hypothetical protein
MTAKTPSSTGQRWEIGRHRPGIVARFRSRYIKASPDSITGALAGAAIPDDFRISMVNAPGADSYPIAGVTWILVYEHPQDALKAKELAAFLTWAETEGQKMARELNFAPAARKRAEQGTSPDQTHFFRRLSHSVRTERLHAPSGSIRKSHRGFPLISRLGPRC